MLQARRSWVPVPAASSPASQMTWCRFSSESFRRLFVFNDQGCGADGCYNLGVASVPLCCNVTFNAEIYSQYEIEP
jgi:hypothetical protein